jgi:hypothetical protein
MGLSRLQNFIKNIDGNVLYVDKTNLDATDSIENLGNSPTRPFKSLQRALIEAVRFSYVSGTDNDIVEHTKINLSPGVHYIDNRPGIIPDWNIGDSPNYIYRNLSTNSNFGPLDYTSNFDINDPNNILYKFNSIHGGVIVPRGVSIVGEDLKKVRIRPLYVPYPYEIEGEDNIDSSCIFRMTGGTVFKLFTILDADSRKYCYYNYDNNIALPLFSHHKLVAFDFADGVNPVKIKYNNSEYSTDRTDLDIYYEKISLAFGEESNRPISPDYPNTIDIQPKVDEYRIVGSRGIEVGITSIRAGDGTTSSTTITVTIDEPTTELGTDTPIQIQGITGLSQTSKYNGQFLVSSVISEDEIQYKIDNPPSDPLPDVSQLASATLSIIPDTVSSASPYICDVSLKSVYGMSGLHVDGSKVEGFKSATVSQFTGISLQKDDNAFVVYNPQTGSFEDNTVVDNLYSNSRAVYKPEYRNYHIKVSNDGYAQIVSIFAIGYAQHFVSESGGDLSVENSSSNFGSKSLIASGFRSESYSRDDVGYITHIISPKEIDDPVITIEFSAIDIEKTNTVGNSSRLYLLGETNSGILPDSIVEGYRIGSKINGTLNVYLENQKYSAQIIMGGTSESSSKKSYKVKKKTNGISNEIVSNIIELDEVHDFINGETVRVISNSGELPDGIVANQIYYVITAGSGDPLLTSTKIKLAQSLNDANSSYTTNPEINIYSNESSDLHIVSRVSDKKAGDIGHPIQYDEVEKNWYISVNSGNDIYNAISSSILSATSRTFIERQQDTRNIFDTIYRFRYVIPKDAPINARPPLDGYILQDSGSVVGTSDEIGKYYTINASTLSNSTDLRNPRFIANAIWSSSGIATFRSELPHELSINTLIETKNIISSLNTLAKDDLGFNGKFTVINIPNPLEFEVELETNPGTFFLEQVLDRDTTLPNFRKVELSSAYIVYRSQEVKPYIRDQQDGVYHLILVNSSYSPKNTYFNSEKYQQPIINLYPQINRDNPTSDPDASICFASPDPIGHVVVNNPEYSLTKETLYKNLNDFGVGIGITNIISTNQNDHTIYTNTDHGLNRITTIQVISPGAGYGNGAPGLIYNALLTGSSNGNGATAVISVNGSGNVTDIKIMNGGSSYNIGDALNIVGVATTSGYVQATALVTGIYNNVGDVITINNIKDPYEEYNQSYRITGISTGTTKQINVSSASSISSFTTSGIGITYSESSIVNLAGKSLSSTIQYNNSTGIGTVTTGQNHGFSINKKITIGGANSDFYNGNFIINNIVSLNQFEVNFGTNTVVPSTTGTIYVYPTVFTSNGGNITKTNEDISGRLISFYDNVTSTLSSAVSSTTATTFVIANATSLGLEIGDYLQVDDEIVRIRVSVTSNNVQVYRGVLGTTRKLHSSNSVIRRIKPRAAEFRRNSLIKAATHKFEHIGFGPGNYSTALPERQDRKLSEIEEILAHKTSIDGGLIVFAGMNDSGDFFIGNKKVNSATGEEKDFDSPIPTITGEELDIGGLDVGFDIITPLEVSISRSINVEGGNDRNIISKFNGPVVFNNKITSNSNKGLEAKSLYLQGDVDISRKYTVGISTPNYPGNYGDIVYDATPLAGGTIGWVYTQGNAWERFGSISNDNVVITNTVGVSVNGVPLGSSNSINLVGTGAAQLSGTYSSGISTITLNVTSGAGVFNSLVIVGPSTFNSVSYYNNGLRATGISSFIGSINISSNANVSGILTATNLNVPGTINATSINVQNFNNTGIVTFSGDLSIGSATRTINSYIRVLSGDSNTTGFQAYGNFSGTGYLYVGKNSLTGGGIAYNGNAGTPFSSGESINTVQFYRVDSGTKTSVFSYPYNSNIVSFAGDINSEGSGIFLTPNSGTTGGLVIRANATTNKNYLQFTNNARTVQWGFADVNSSGDFSWSGKLKSTAVETTSTSTVNATVSGILTATQIQATTFVGGGTIPIGGIIMWSGSVGSIPTNWKLCDGSSGTPDLRDRFIVGSGSAYSVGDTGGSNSVTLNSNQIQSHNHSYSYNTAGANFIGISALPGPLSVVTGVTNSTTTTTTGNSGSGQSHENRPPYYALAFIMRIA